MIPYAVLGDAILITPLTIAALVSITLPAQRAVVKVVAGVGQQAHVISLVGVPLKVYITPLVPKTVL